MPVTEFNKVIDLTWLVKQKEEETTLQNTAGEPKAQNFLSVSVKVYNDSILNSFFFMWSSSNFWGRGRNPVVWTFSEISPAAHSRVNISF